MLNKLDDIVISAFANKCIQIYKLTNNDADYLLVVDNCELKEDDCCNTYFVLLDNNYYYFARSFNQPVHCTFCHHTTQSKII